MNEHQESMAEFILQTLFDRNGCMNNSDLDRLITNKYGETTTTRKDRFYVKSQLEDDYKLIRQKNALILLSDNGYTAKRIGFHKYLTKLHNNQRLDIKLKQLEVWSKMLTVVKDAPTVMIAAIEGIILIALLLEKLLSN